MTEHPVRTPGGRPIGTLGTGSYPPAGTVSNELVAERAGTTPERICAKTGIHSRCYAADHEATSDPAVEAARAALADAGIRADQLGRIVVATSTPDHPRPATACPVRHRIGAPGAAVREQTQGTGQ
ncbi:beta-ketoacyl-[acyl-carrier-protein] synthase family protein [Streptomyces malaysiensis]|uniref:hypothetical protein n=1 Tax=Streptomyces malaysiensis TaxID=92644 RepID=UPI00371BC9DE